jgi:hypothetical protein
VELKIHAEEAEMKLKMILVVGAAAIIAGSAMARTEPNSFLNRPAMSKAAMSKMIRSDRTLQSRVMRHWGFTREQAFSWVDSLQMSKLPETGVWLVYNCQQNEAIQARLRTLYKGRAIWVNSAGEPVALVSCFNPIRRGTDTQSIEPTAEIFAEPTSERPITPNPEPEALFTPPTDLNPELQASAQPLAGVLPGQLIPAAAGGFAFPWWIAGAGLLIPHGGGDNPKPPTPPNPPPAVPEPGLMIAFGVAAAAAARKKKKAAK